MKKEDKIRILQEVVKIPTINDKEEQIADYLHDLFEKYDIHSEKIRFASGRSSLVAEIGNGSGKVLAVSGHMDVVDPGDESKWKYPPFSATIEGDKLYGRGTTDMKSGTVALALAMIELTEEHIVPNGKIRYMATVGEEIGELGAAELTKKGYMKDVNALLIAEPTNYVLVYTHKGSINYTVVSKGKTAHSSMPEEGINAINPLLDFGFKANEWMNQIAASKQNKVLGNMIHNITIFNGGNQVNSIPGDASLQGNIRTIPEIPNENIIKKLNEIIDEVKKSYKGELSLIIDNNKVPVNSNPDSGIIRIAKSVTKGILNKDLQTAGISATTDAAEFLGTDTHLDFLVYGPGEAALPHQINEYVSIQNYLDMIDIYKGIFKEYLK